MADVFACPTKPKIKKLEFQIIEFLLIIDGIGDFFCLEEQKVYRI